MQNRHASGKKADLRGADLRKVNFEGADLRFADLRAADLSGSNLSQADMSNADLRGANLSEAVCIGTKFVNARLEGSQSLRRRSPHGRHGVFADGRRQHDQPVSADSQRQAQQRREISRAGEDA